MSERIGESFNDTKGNNRQSVPSYQSSWMARWMQSSGNVAAETSNSSGNEVQYASQDHSLMNRVGLIETKTVEIVGERLRVSSKSSGNEEMCSPVVKSVGDTDGMQALSTVSGRFHDRGKDVERKSEIQFPSLVSGIPAAVGTSSRRCHYLGEGTSENPIERAEIHFSAKASSLVVSKPLPEKIVEPSMCIVPYNFDFKKCASDKGKATLSSSDGKSTSFPDSLEMIEHKQCHKGSQSTALVLGRNSESDMFNAPSTSDHHLQQLGPELFQKMQKCSGVRQFPSQYIASERTKSEKLHYDHYSLQKSPNCVHDVEKMRICTTLDSVEGSHGGCPRFSQTTHNLLITKKTDVNLSEENDTFRSSRVVTKVNGNKSSDLHRMSLLFNRGNQGVILKALSSSIDSEGKGHVGDLNASKVTLKNESSAETDTMDIDLFKEKNPQSGTNSTASTKAINMDSNMPPQADAASSREVGSRNTGLPDINLKPPSPDEASLSETICRSSSRTQSLEMDVLLAHAEQPEPEFSLSPDDSTKENPSSRWIKRLKCSSPMPSAQGTKSSILAEISHDKVSKFCTRLLKTRMSNSQTYPRKHQGKETMLPDKSEHQGKKTMLSDTSKLQGKETMLPDKIGDLSKKDEDFSVDPKMKDEELLLSLTWIQRWLCNESRISLKKPETVVVSEPQSSKLALDDLPKKQFPSIAAMALMGKAMNGFQKCELQKRGPFTVWNTKSF